MNSADFKRERMLTLEHVFGLVLSMSASRNENGYDISSQNYFREPGTALGKPIDPVKRQSVSEARSKIGWEAFEFLLGAANLESEKLPPEFLFHGHVTRSIDGTSFYAPRSEDLLPTSA